MHQQNNDAVFDANPNPRPIRHNCFHKPEDVEVGMDMSLKNLDLDYGEVQYSHGFAVEC